MVVSEVGAADDTIMAHPSGLSKEMNSRCLRAHKGYGSYYDFLHLFSVFKEDGQYFIRVHGLSGMFRLKGLFRPKLLNR